MKSHDSSANRAFSYFSVHLIHKGIIKVTFLRYQVLSVHCLGDPGVIVGLPLGLPIWDLITHVESLQGEMKAISNAELCHIQASPLKVLST